MTLLGGLLAIGVGVLVAHLVMHRSDEWLKDIALRAGLLAQGDVYVSYKGVFPMEFRPKDPAAPAMATLVMDARALLTSDISVARASYFSDRREVTGVGELDDALIFSGSQAVACAYFAPIAASVIALMKGPHSVVIEGGLIRFTVSETSSITLQALEDALVRAESFGKILRGSGGTMAERLLANLTRLSEPHARERSLHALIRVGRRSPELERALSLARRDESPSLRLAVATFTGDTALMHELALDDTLDATTRLGVLAELKRIAPLAEVEALMRRLLAADDDALAGMAAKTLAVAKDTESAPRLLMLLGRASEARQVAFLNALVVLGDPGMVPALLAHAAELSGAAQLAAIDALRAWAGTESIPALRELQAKVRRPAQQAIAAAVADIQARARGAEAGQVSIMVEQGGELGFDEGADGG